jgi:small conductance mechanosensitive channel
MSFSSRLLSKSPWYTAALLTVFIACSARAENGDDTSSEAAEPQPTTTADPNIPVDQLRLLVIPLTAEELQIEAEAWRDLVKAKVAEISQSEISAKKAGAGDAEAAEETTDDGEELGQQNGEQAEQAEKTTQSQKTDHLETAAELRDDRTALVDRLNTVLDEWEAKGGDVESYRQYVTAVSGLNVDVSDASATWVAIKGWLMSKEGGIRWLWNIGKFLLILLAFWILSRVLGNVVDHVVARWEDSTALLRHFLSGMVRKIVFVVGLVVAVSALEVDITPLLAAIGAAGLVVGLALQGTLSNFASGILILAYRPFDTGDVVDAGGRLGCRRIDEPAVDSHQDV